MILIVEISQFGVSVLIHLDCDVDKFALSFACYTQVFQDVHVKREVGPRLEWMLQLGLVNSLVHAVGGDQLTIYFNSFLESHPGCRHCSSA